MRAAIRPYSMAVAAFAGAAINSDATTAASAAAGYQILLFMGPKVAGAEEAR